jgi:magnesium transporter
VGAAFGLHRLWLEDVINVHQRPKVEHHGDVRFVVVRAIEGEGPAETDQISLFLGPGFVITFQERHGDGWDEVRARIRRGTFRIRQSGPDYLAYALLDATVDGYFPALERLGERIDRLEDDLIERPGSWCLADIHDVRRDLLTVRRAAWPLREAIQHLLREHDPVFQEETRVYLGDCYDHTVQIMDLVENDREIVSGLLDVYLSSMNHRMNEVMKVLTVISTIFIPLTFLAGVYGMNFDPDAGPWSMPELRRPWGYAACLAVMAGTALSLVLWFRRRGWIFAGATRRPDGSR